MTLRPAVELTTLTLHIPVLCLLKTPNAQQV